MTYLHLKGALTLPSVPLQNALLQVYVEYVHPYMPLMDLQDFLSIVSRRDGLNGQTSLFLYQAVMFSATAFIDVEFLREAGYSSRKAARKAFFQKTRVSRCTHVLVPSMSMLGPFTYSYDQHCSYSTTLITNSTVWFWSRPFCS